MQTNILRRLLGAMAAISVVGMSMAASGAAAAELTTFKVGEAAPANTFLAIWMAEAAGL